MALADNGLKSAESFRNGWCHRAHVHVLYSPLMVQSITKAVYWIVLIQLNKQICLPTLGIIITLGLCDSEVEFVGSKSDSGLIPAPVIMVSGVWMVMDSADIILYTACHQMILYQIYSNPFCFYFSHFSLLFFLFLGHFSVFSEYCPHFLTIFFPISFAFWAFLPP